MVLTGQFSSGKSKLITALTDRAVEPVSDADIATDDVREYLWDGAVVLLIRLAFSRACGAMTNWPRRRLAGRTSSCL